MEHLWSDVRFSLRTLGRNRLFTALTVATLALGIGANAAIFSVVSAVLLRPLPFPRSDRIVQILRHYDEGDEAAVSVPIFLYWRERSHSFEAVAAYQYIPSGMNLSQGGLPERISGIAVTESFFPVLGVGPARGRAFSAEEDLAGGAKAVVLSDRLWRSRFGADSGLVGRTVRLNDEAYVVLGVMPQGFDYPEGTDLWTPLGLPKSSTDSANLYPVVGRLKDGVTLEEAREEMRVVHQQFNRDHPDTPSSRTAACILLQERIVGSARPVLLMLFGAVGFILLIACANVANLLLANCNRRRQEFAVRAALGASRGRLARQMLVESLVLSFLGGGLGLGLAFWCVDLARTLGPAELPRLHSVSVDGGALGFTFVLSLLAGVLFGVGPATQASRGALQDTLKEGGRGVGDTGRGAFRAGLVVGELAVCLVLVVGAALLVKSLIGLERVQPGFDPRDILTLQMSLPAKYGVPDAQNALYRQILERLKSIPGVEGAATINSLPTELGPDLPVSVEGRTHADPNEADGECQYRAISADYFRLMRISVVRGRPFSERDSLRSGSVAIVNETAARAMWPGDDPIGKEIRIGKTMGPEWADPAPREVVGIVTDVRDSGLSQPAPLEVFVPYAQVPAPIVAMAVKLLPTALVVRTTGAPRAAQAAVQNVVFGVDRNQAVANVRTMEEILSASVAGEHFNTWLLSLFALLALALAAVGTYGVVSYMVNQRTHEIALRMALGAQRGDVMRLVLGGAMRLVALGVGVGWVAALGLTRVLSHSLFGVTATDPATFVAVGFALGGVAFIASYVPALRAVRVLPTDSLREQ